MKDLIHKSSIIPSDGPIHIDCIVLLLSAIFLKSHIPRYLPGSFSAISSTGFPSMRDMLSACHSPSAMSWFDTVDGKVVTARYLEPLAMNFLKVEYTSDNWRWTRLSRHRIMSNSTGVSSIMERFQKPRLS